LKDVRQIDVRLTLVKSFGRVLTLSSQANSWLIEVTRYPAKGTESPT